SPRGGGRWPRPRWGGWPIRAVLGPLARRVMLLGLLAMLVIVTGVIVTGVIVTGVIVTRARQPLAPSPHQLLDAVDEARSGDCLPVRVHVIDVQAHIDTDHQAGGAVDDAALRLEDEVSVVAISTTNEPHSFDLLQREGRQIPAPEERDSSHV